MTGLAAASLSLPSRIGQLNQRLKGWEAVRWTGSGPRITDVLRAELDRFGSIGAIYGVLRADPWSGVHWGNGIPPERSAEACAAVQEFVRSHGDGTPVLFVEEAPHGIQALGATTLPVNLALGAGMDVELTETLGAIVAAEASARGTHLVLVSGLDVLRDPRWGRAEECYSEDPVLAAALVAATVRGLQGAGPGEPIGPGHVAVVAKHLAAQGAGIGGRNGSSAPIGRRELGEIHLRPAHAAARAGVAGFMSAYNDIDGIPRTGNRELLTGTLREQWGWDGIVMSDGTAIDRLRDSAPDSAAAAALALTAGVDLSLWDEAYTHLGEALERGLVDETQLNRAVDRVLALKRRVGLLNPQRPADPAPRHLDIDVEGALDRAARQSIVLVDPAGVLPLSSSATVAVVGPNGDDLEAQLGDYTPPRPASEPEASTVRSALVARLGAERVRAARGSRRLTPGDEGWLDEVAAACDGADAAVVVLGGTSRRSYQDAFADNGAVDDVTADTTNGEGVDLASVALPPAQLEVARTAKSSGLPVVAVVIDGRPRALTELHELVDALVVAPFPGPRGGAAVVETLLTGRAAGRLPATFPAADAVMPVAHDERTETAHGYLDADLRRNLTLGTSHLPDLHARIAEDVAVTTGALAAGATAEIVLDVRNTGPCAADVPLPVYGRRHEAGLRPRRRQLLTILRARVPAHERVRLRARVGLVELGSWATGEPVAVPVRVSIWCSPDLDPPPDSRTVRITADEGAARP